jgi:hypothetical protein
MRLGILLLAMGIAIRVLGCRQVQSGQQIGSPPLWLGLTGKNWLSADCCYNPLYR